MKYFIVIFILFGISSTIYAQFVPQKFAIKINSLGNDVNSINNEFKFYSCSQELLKNDFGCLKQEMTSEFKTDTNVKSENLFIYIKPDFGHKEDVLILKINHDDEVMTLYIKLSYNLGEGEIIFFSNFKFNKGNYLFDMRNGNKKYRIIEKRFDGNTFIEFSKKHKISIRKLNKIMKNKNCN